MLTCDTALDQYYKEHIARNAVARRRAEYAIDSLNEFFKGVPLSMVDIPMCREYLDQRDASDSTVRRELGVLSAAANHAKRWRRISPADLPSIELPKESPSKRVWLYKDELADLLEAAEAIDERCYRFIQLAYHTASRRGAIETLEWSRVDEQERRINLSAPNEVQTKKRRPIVPISETMAEELKAMRAKSTNQWVLGNPSTIYDAFLKVANCAGLGTLKIRGMRDAGRLTPHVLRHSRATHLLQDGKNPWTVANLLGDTLTTVLRVYGHACPDYLAEAVA